MQGIASSQNPLLAMTPTIANSAASGAKTPEDIPFLPVDWEKYIRSFVHHLQAGDETSFDFDFFANSRVMALDSEPLEGHLAGDEEFNLSPRNS